MLYHLSYTPVLISGASSDRPYLSTPFKWQAAANAGRHHTGPQANDKLRLSNDKLRLSYDICSSWRLYSIRSLLSVAVHPFQTLFSQPGGSCVGIVGLHPGKCAPRRIPALQLIVAIANFEQGIRHLA